MLQPNIIFGYLYAITPIMRLLLFLLLSASFAQNGFAQLTTLIPEPYPAIGYLGARLDDICMINDTAGFVVTASGLILKTTDRFHSATLKHNITPSYCRSVAFINEQVGYVGSLDGALFETRDGGETWDNIFPLMVANDTVSLPLRHGVCGLAEAGNTVYACGAYFGRPFVARSNGFGQNWTYYDMRAYAVALVDMLWTNTNTGFVTGRDSAANGIILKTTNGGQSWTVAYNTGLAAEYVWKLFKLNDSVLYACVESSAPNNPHILKSTDGGATWTSYLVDVYYRDLEGVGFINEQQGYVGGNFEGYYATNDGGLSWQYISDASVSYLNRFITLPNGNLVASGKGVFQAVDTTPSHVGNLNQLPAYNPIKVYPNPVRSKFNVELVLNESTHGHLVVYDITGKVLDETTTHQSWAKGTHQQFFDASSYSVGTIYIGFISDHGHWYAPLVVEK